MEESKLFAEMEAAEKALNDRFNDKPLEITNENIQKVKLD